MEPLKPNAQIERKPLMEDHIDNLARIADNLERIDNKLANAVRRIHGNYPAEQPDTPETVTPAPNGMIEELTVQTNRMNVLLPAIEEHIESIERAI